MKMSRAGHFRSHVRFNNIIDAARDVAIVEAPWTPWIMLAAAPLRCQMGIDATRKGHLPRARPPVARRYSDERGKIKSLVDEKWKRCGLL